MAIVHLVIFLISTIACSLLYVPLLNHVFYQCLPAGFNWDLQPLITGRNECGFVGLRNGGATCYMNAVLQQLFMQPGLAEALLSIYETDEQLDEKNILFQTQKVSNWFVSYWSGPRD